VAERVAKIEAQGWPSVPTMLTEDPPAHNYYRRLVSRVFTPRYVAGQEDEVRRVVRSLVDGVLTRQEVEFVGDFAAPLPLIVIARILGVPQDRIADFRRWSHELTLTIGADAADDARIHQAEQILEFQHYFAGELERRRAEPRDDLLSGLAHAHVRPDGEDERELSTAECLSIIRQLLAAGNETTAKLLSGALHLLATERRWWDWLRADVDSRVGRFVEECLRYLCPVQGMFRVTTEETELGGVRIPVGARVVLSYGSANRDGNVFTAPDSFDPERENAAEHLGFGHGLHYCLGAPLARLQARLALTELANRIDAIELLQENDFHYTPSFLLRGLEALHVKLIPGPANGW
jgi:cytochrome P450